MTKCQDEQFLAGMASLRDASSRLSEDAPSWIKEIHKNRDLKVVSHLNFRRITPD